MSIQIFMYFYSKYILPKKLHFFRSKITPLQEFLPKNFVDFHSHLLPNIDDGSSSLNESISLINSFKKAGINNIITTPHILGDIWPNNRDIIEQKLSMVKQELAKQKIEGVRLNAAAEYMLDELFLNHLGKGNLLTIKDNYILIELSFVNHPENIFEMLFEIQTKGYTPILAHPERYYYYHHKFDMYRKLKESGCLFQLNLLSLVKYYGRDVYKVAIELLKSNMIDFTGTDVHNTNHFNHLKKLGTTKNIKLLNPILENNSIFK